MVTIHHLTFSLYLQTFLLTNLNKSKNIICVFSYQAVLILDKDPFVLKESASKTTRK